MQLLDNNYNHPNGNYPSGVRSDTSVVEVIKVNPIIQLVLLAGAVAMRYRIGSDSLNYIKFDIAHSELSVGWTLIKLDLGNPSTSVGSVNWSSITYQLLRVYEIAGNTHDFDIYVDSNKRGEATNTSWDFLQHAQRR